jgi:WD40 repeat protein
MLLLSCEISSTSEIEVTETNVNFIDTKLTPTLTNTPEVKTRMYDESKSPDGEWNAIVSIKEIEKDQEIILTVSNKSTGQEWVFKEANSNEIATPRPYFLYPYIFKWSNDNKFLYFSYLWDKNDGCFGYFQPGGFGLKRINLSNGEIDVVREEKATWMAFSPDEKYLAYIETFDGNVSIYNIEIGVSQNYPLPNIDSLNMFPHTTDLYWSPDGNSLIYARYIGRCDLLSPFLYVVQLFSDTEEQIVLVNNKEGFSLVEWSIQDKIILKDNEGKLYWLNLNTKEIIPASP